jgi:hypothetical protein
LKELHLNKPFCPNSLQHLFNLGHHLGVHVLLCRKKRNASTHAAARHIQAAWRVSAGPKMYQIGTVCSGFYVVRSAMPPDMQQLHPGCKKLVQEVEEEKEHVVLRIDWLVHWAFNSQPVAET